MNTFLTYDLLLQPSQEPPVLLLTGICCHEVPGTDPMDCLVQAVRQQAGQELGLEFGVGVKLVQQLSLSLEIKKNKQGCALVFSLGQTLTSSIKLNDEV